MKKILVSMAAAALLLSSVASAAFAFPMTEQCLKGNGEVKDNGQCGNGNDTQVVNPGGQLPPGQQ